MSELTEILAEHLGHIEIDDDGAYWWKCNCGDESDESEIFASEQEAEEWGRTHLAEVIEASDWLREQLAKALESAAMDIPWYDPEMADEVISWLHECAQAIREDNDDE